MVGILLFIIAMAEPPPHPTPTPPEWLRMNTQNQFSAIRRSERQVVQDIWWYENKGMIDGIFFYFCIVIICIKLFSFEICVGLSGCILGKMREKQLAGNAAFQIDALNFKNIAALSPLLGHGLSLAFNLLQEYQFRFSIESISGRYRQQFLNYWLPVN